MQLHPRESDLHSTSTTSVPADLSEVPLEYYNFADVFRKSKASILAPHCKHNLKIKLEEGASPPLGTTYSLSPSKLESLWMFLDEHLVMGFIRPSFSAHAALVLFVHKKNGSLCLCINFRGLNKITKKDHYPLPPISDLLDALSHTKIYTKLNLWHVYHLVRIAKGNKWKTSFCTCYGSYKWLVMPFSLINTPVAFQQFVNTIFANILDVCIIVYLDNILIYSKDKASHKEHVQEALSQLCKHGLYVKPEKCEFHTNATEYLGYQLSPSGLTMSTGKVQTIQDWPKPCKVKDIQSFLEFANFYHCFIDNYSNIITPLTQLTCKGTPWNFSDSCCSTFCKLKDAFTSTPILTHWILDAPMILETDTSDYAIAGIFSIHYLDEEICPVAYYSWTLSVLELNYIQTWQHYLEGSASLVNIVTDHKNLKYFVMTKLLTHWQAQWSEFLSQFNMIVCFRPS